MTFDGRLFASKLACFMCFCYCHIANKNLKRDPSVFERITLYSLLTVIKMSYYTVHTNLGGLEFKNFCISYFGKICKFQTPSNYKKNEKFKNPFN